MVLEGVVSTERNLTEELDRIRAELARAAAERAQLAVEREEQTRRLQIAVAELSKQFDVATSLRRRLAMVVRDHTQGTFRFDMPSRAFDFDAGFASILELPRKTRGFEDVIARVHADDRAKVEAAWWSCVDDGNALDVDFRVTRPIAGPGLISLTAQRELPLRHRGAYLVGLCIDLLHRPGPPHHDG